MTVEVKFNEEEIKAKIINGTNYAQMRLDVQVMKDSNYYCPLDTSMLQKSVITNSLIGSGLLVWNTPYARRQYYEENNKSHQKNPNACGKWFEAAKAVKAKEWERIAKNEYSSHSK